MNDTYDAIAALRSSAVNCYRRHGPWIYYLEHELGAIKGETTDPMKLGTLEHLMILEPHRVDPDVAVWKGSQRRGKDWDKFEKEHESQLIVTEGQFTTAAVMSANVRQHSTAQAIFSLPAQVERTIRFRWRGLDCKIRPDLLVDDEGDHWCFDVKTCGREKNPNRGYWMGKLGFKKNRAGEYYLPDYGDCAYPIQLAFYRAGLAAAGWSGRFGHLVISTVDPYLVWVHEIGQDIIDLGEEECIKVMDEISERRNSGIWEENYQFDPMGPALSLRPDTSNGEIQWES